MRSLSIVAVAVLARVAAAQPAPVRLDGAVPVVIAVSSTVANAKILPAHLVDGRLDTAWNSRTGDLVGAWIAVRVPADATVARLAMTVGFTAIDPKLGDLFTQNPRIAKVRVTRDGKPIVTRALDPDNRALQDIPIGTAGGELRIEVVEIVPGSKPSWREISVSELQIWGTPGAERATTRPIVRVGSFDPVSPADCAAAVHVRDRVVETAVVDLGDDVYACRVVHGEVTDNNGSTGFPPFEPRKETIRQVEVAVIRGATHAVVGSPISQTTTSVETMPGLADAADVTGVIDVRAFALAPHEPAMIVEVTDQRTGPMSNTGTTTSTLYRATRAGLDAVLTFTSTWNDGESDDDDRCALAVGKARSPLPDLDLACTKSEGRWHGEDPRGNGRFDAPRTAHYRWSGTQYLKR